MMKIFIATVFLLLPISWSNENHHAPNPLKAHLSYRNKTLHLHAQLTAEPKVGAESFLTLEARSGKDHSLVSLTDTIEVVLWMPEMNHGSAPTQVGRAINANGDVEVGKFIVRNIYFVMGGKWDVRVSITDSNGVKETQTFTVTLPDSGSHH
jgi:hypothetical protein